MLLIAVANRPELGPTTVRQAPWYAFLGGCLGPCYVSSAVFLAPRLGFAAFQLSSIAGQLLVSLLLDTIGFLHLPKKKPTAQRLLAMCTLAIGVVLTSSGAQSSADLALWHIVWATSTGAVFPLQGCFNAVLAKHVLTTFRAVFISFFVGASVLAVLATVVSAVQQQQINIQGGEWWMWLGGACGGVLVTCNAYGIPILGASAFSVLFLSAQLVTALIYDATGVWPGFETKPATATRLAGVALALLSAGAYQLDFAQCCGNSNRKGQAS
jgi:transporter family-2 protein